MPRRRPISDSNALVEASGSFGASGFAGSTNAPQRHAGRAANAGRWRLCEIATAPAAVAEERRNARRVSCGTSLLWPTVAAGRQLRRPARRSADASRSNGVIQSAGRRTPQRARRRCLGGVVVLGRVLFDEAP